jgi:hypothetical protein
MIQTPDPFNPDNMITIQDPEWILRQHEDHTLCPICVRLRSQLAAAETTDFDLLPPDCTIPYRGKR